MPVPVVGLNEGQHVDVLVTSLDAFGSPTTNIGGSHFPSWSVSVPGALIFGDTTGTGTVGVYKSTISLPSPPIAGNFTITATVLVDGATTLTATGVVTVATNGPIASIVISFGTPTP
jgi:hypothetical protein